MVLTQWETLCGLFFAFFEKIVVPILTSGGGAWETVASFAAQGSRRSFDLPFVPRRCGSLRLRLRGKGQITLRGLVRTIAPAKGKLWEEDASWQA